jgi:hypothetical protein
VVTLSFKEGNILKSELLFKVNNEDLILFRHFLTFGKEKKEEKMSLPEF